MNLHARHEEALKAAEVPIAKNQETMVAHGLLSKEAAAAAAARIRTLTGLEEAVRGAQFIVVGLHWMNPAHLMPPVEVTRGARTAPAVVELTAALANRIGRVPIRVEKDTPGLLWNRPQFGLVREAIHIIAEGIADPEAVDMAMTAGLGLRWATVGPFRTMDLGGDPRLPRHRGVPLPGAVGCADGPEKPGGKGDARPHGGTGGAGILRASPGGPRGGHREPRRQALCAAQAPGRTGSMSEAGTPCIRRRIRVYVEIASRQRSRP